MTAPLINSRTKAEEVLGDIAILTIGRNFGILEMDEKLTAIREQYEPHISDFKKKIEEKTALLESWAAANPEEFGKKKSIEMLHGVFGYRTGTPKLQPVLRKTWAKILETIKILGFGGYVRSKEEVNKEAILSDAAQGLLTPESLKSIGVSVVQDEAFFVEPNLQPLANRQEAA
jgi:phage host-nuclease inhibitor protein Gam